MVEEYEQSFETREEAVAWAEEQGCKSITPGTREAAEKA
jgi:hypothetical protein